MHPHPVAVYRVQSVAIAVDRSLPETTRCWLRVVSWMVYQSADHPADGSSGHDHWVRDVDWDEVVFVVLAIICVVVAFIALLA